VDVDKGGCSAVFFPEGIAPRFQLSSEVEVVAEVFRLMHALASVSSAFRYEDVFGLSRRYGLQILAFAVLVAAIPASLHGELCAQ